jgi:hypothetical protein
VLTRGGATDLHIVVYRHSRRTFSKLYRWPARRLYICVRSFCLRFLPSYPPAFAAFTVVISRGNHAIITMPVDRRFDAILHNRPRIARTFADAMADMKY